MVRDASDYYYSTLGTINGDLAEITAQNRWAIALYKELNTSKLEECISRLSTALERFKVTTKICDQLIVTCNNVTS